jgi:sirohydrochlorin ferrochelatase
MRAILIVDHGSRRPEANRQLEAVAAVVRRQSGAATVVEHAHMELAEPSIAEGFARCVAAGASEVIVHPYMLSPGRHATEDMPRLVAAAAGAFPEVSWRVTEPLGVHELIGRVVLERCGVPSVADG